MREGQGLRKSKMLGPVAWEPAIQRTTQRESGHTGAGLLPAALLVSGELRLQALLRPPDFPGFFAQMKSLGEPPGAIRQLALPHGGPITLGK